MVENNQDSRVSLDTLAHTQDDVSNGVDYVNFLVSKLQQTMENPSLHGEIMLQLWERGILNTSQEGRVPKKPLSESSKKGTSMGDKKNTQVEHQR